MKTLARVFSNKPCMMVVNTADIKMLKTNKIVCLDIKVDVCCKMEFLIQKEGEIEKKLSIALTPNSVSSTYVVFVDWTNEQIVCYQDNTDPTFRHLCRDKDNSPHCFIYDAKTFSINHSIDMPYEYVEDYNKFGLAKVKYNNHYGMIDKNCKIIIPLEYYQLHTLNTGLIIGYALSNNGIYVFSSTGEFLFEREGVMVPNRTIKASNDLIPIRTYNGYGFIDYKNNIAITPMYGEDIDCFGDGELFIVSLARKSADGISWSSKGVIDRFENVVLPFNYDKIYPIKCTKNGEYIFVVENGLFTIINSSQEQIVDKEFESVRFGDGLIYLLHEQEWFVYDRDVSLIAKFCENEICIRDVMGTTVCVAGRWLPINKVLNYDY